MGMTQPAFGLGPGRPSRTSIVVAAARAFGAREPDESVRNPDWLAERLLGPEELQLLGEHPLASALDHDYQQARGNPLVAGTANFMLVRTRFIDEHLQRAIQNGATQLVILGAGFDTRAYRFQELLRSCKVFEVDHHATQEIKKRRLEHALTSFPAHVCFVELDFTRDTLADVLHRAGYNPAERTFFIWEGVTMYLHEDAVRDTLRTIAQAAPGSSLVLDYASKATIDALQRYPELPQHRHTTEWGEPWIFGVADGKEHEFFRECGLELRESISLVRGPEQRRYLTRANGKRLSGGFRRRGPAAARSRNRRGPGPLRILTMTIGVLWTILTTRTKWYALAEVIVPPH